MNNIPGSIEQGPGPDPQPKAGRLVPVSDNLPAHPSPYGAVGGYGPEAGGGIDLRSIIVDYWRIFYKRRWLILGIITMAVIVGATRTLMETPLYASAVRVQIDRDTAKIYEAGGVAPAEVADSTSLLTHFEILKSQSMAARVVSALRLHEDQDFFKPRSYSIVGAIAGIFWPETKDVASLDQASREAWAAGIVRGNVAVHPVPGSRLFDIAYTDPNPVRAQRIANAFADAYLNSTIDKRFKSTEYAKTFLEDQSKQLQLRLKDSEQQLLQFSEDNKIIVLSERSSIAESNLQAANGALSGLIAERIRAEQIWRQIEASQDVELPQFQSNAVIQSLRASRKILETEYQEKLQTFRPAYPAMVEIQTKLKEIDRQLAKEVRTIRSTLKGAYDTALRQETQTKQQVEELRTEVLDLQRRLIQYNILKREVDTNRSLYNGILQRSKEVEVAGGIGTNNIFIVDPAQVPGAPFSPNFKRALMLALALGVAAGGAAAYVLELLDDTLGTAEEVERLTGLSILGIIPSISADSVIEDELADPRSALSESYRSLSTSLQFATDSGLPRSLLVTSASQSEGKSITALAIARHFATMGLKVLLVDADLRNPSMHTKLGLSNAHGLSNVLTGGCTPPEAMQATDIHDMAFMATGPLPPNAADLLASPRLHSMLSVGAEVFDLVVLDGPPVMGLADAQLLSNVSQATVFVVAAGQAKSGAVRGALRRLDLARAPIIGAVLTKLDAKVAGYGYGYGYGYGAFTYGQASTEASQARLPSGGNQV